MRKTTRKIQKINYIPSKYNFAFSRRDEIKLLVEDPLPKNSSQSYFIQACDLIATIIYYYSAHKMGLKITTRITRILNFKQIEAWLNVLAPILNTKAAEDCKYGVVTYPK